MRLRLSRSICLGIMTLSILLPGRGRTSCRECCSNLLIMALFADKSCRMALDKDSRWERRTWPVLRRLAKEVPEAGLHVQSEFFFLSLPCIYTKW